MQFHELLLPSLQLTSYNSMPFFFFKTVPGAQVPGAQEAETENVHARRIPRTPTAPWASISSSLMNNLGKPGASGRVETHTNVEFPLEFCLSKKPCPQLAGIGVRTKRLLGIKNLNIYAAGEKALFAAGCNL